MGYTHYYRQGKTIETAVWERLTKATIGVLSIAKEMGVTIVGGMGEAGSKPEISDSCIALNGNPDHETLYLERVPTIPAYRAGQGHFAFCKTAYKPYDVVVTAILCLAAHITEGAFKVSSDGGPSDWAEGLALANKVVSGVQLPQRVLDPEFEG